jgi:glycosyltransferase involved in cell wall biosynthesis
MASALESDLGPIVTMMPGIRPGCGKHVELPPITAFFWHDSAVLSLGRALWQRIRNNVVLFVEVVKAKPSVCICIEPDSWLIAGFARRLYGTRLAVDLQEYYPDRSLAFPKVIRRPIYNVIRGVMRILARHTELIIHVSPERERVYSWIKGKRKTLYMLYPESAITGPRAMSDESRSNRVTIAHAGALRPTYAGKELLQAMDLIREQAPNCILRVWGGLVGMADMSRQSRALLDTGTIDIKSVVSKNELLIELTSCDIGLSLVLPIDNTHIYAQPRKLYEYMAAGIPVVGSDVPTIRRIIEDFQCGVVVDARDPRAIAEAIIRLSRDPELRKKLGENGRQAIRSRFNAAAERERLVTSVRSLLTGTRA